MAYGDIYTGYDLAGGVQPPGAALNDLANRRFHWCIYCNAFVPNSTSKMHSDFHKTYTNRKDGNMTGVLWCDLGDHAFKANSPGSIHYTGSQVNDNSMIEETAMDACAAHNPFRAKPENIVKELNAELNAKYDIDSVE